MIEDDMSPVTITTEFGVVLAAIKAMEHKSEHFRKNPGWGNVPKEENPWGAQAKKLHAALWERNA